MKPNYTASNQRIAQVAVNMGLVTPAQAREVLEAAELLERAGMPVPGFLDSLVQKRLITLAQREQLEASLENLEAGRVRRLGKYRLLHKLGEGGMGAVYLAEDTKLERKCAIKLLPPEFSRDPKRVGKFMAEAKLTAALNHVNIIQCYDIDQVEGFFFYAMEYLEGRSLEEVVTRAGRLTVDECLNYAIQLTRGLEHAHAKGIIHRDIKPSNAYVTKDGTLKVLDLGLSIQTTGFNLAMAGHAIGTPLYISPEQASGRADVDERSDIYSVGILMFRLLTGEVPYLAATPSQVMQMHLTAPIPNVRERVSEVPQELGVIVRKCMAKLPNERFQSCQALLDDLESLRNSQVIGQHREDVRSGRVGGKHRVLQSGERFGKYKILRKLGEGTMGVLYLAEDTLLTRQVALKVLPRDLSLRAQFADRFRAEIKSIAAVTHANIAESHDVGLIDEHLYYDMEYIEGQSLAEVIHRVMRLEPRKVLDILLQLVRAVRVVHKAGRVHRHIHANNVLLTKQGSAKLTMLSSGTEKPDTWSPEQARELSQIDGRCDIYSLGCLFFYMLTGHMPYQGANNTMLLTKHINEPVPNPRNLAPNTPGACCQVLGMMMAKALPERYENCDLLLEDLEQLVLGKPPVHAAKRPEPVQVVPVRRKRSQSSGRYPRHPMYDSRLGGHDSRGDSRGDTRSDSRSDSRTDGRLEGSRDARSDSRTEPREGRRERRRQPRVGLSQSHPAQAPAPVAVAAAGDSDPGATPLATPAEPTVPVTATAKIALKRMLPKHWVGWAAIGLTVALGLRAGLFFWFIHTVLQPPHPPPPVAPLTPPDIPPDTPPADDSEPPRIGPAAPEVSGIIPGGRNCLVHGDTQSGQRKTCGAARPAGGQLSLYETGRHGRLPGACRRPAEFDRCLPGSPV